MCIIIWQKNIFFLTFPGVNRTRLIWIKIIYFFLFKNFFLNFFSKKKFLSYIYIRGMQSYPRRSPGQLPDHFWHDALTSNSNISITAGSWKTIFIYFYYPYTPLSIDIHQVGKFENFWFFDFSCDWVKDHILELAKKY